jgi:CRP-like cAMP-binding protein
MSVSAIYELPFADKAKLTGAELQLLRERIHIRQLKKKEKILIVGELETDFNCVHKGLVRQYYIHNNKEINTQFAVEGDIVCAAYSYFSQQPSAYFIETVTPTTLLSIKMADMDALMASGGNFVKMGRLLMTQLFLYKEEREKELLTYDATARVERFFKNKPTLALQLPQTYIASYLNIQPETYSKLKRLLLEKM